MKYIQLSNCDEKTIVDDEDYERLIKYKWRKDVSGYAIRTLNTSSRGGKARKQLWQPLQRELMGRKEGLVIDHINRTRLDNRKVNLRFCTIQQNLMNSKRTSRWGYKGVSKDYNKWTFRIKIEGKVHYGKTFASAEAAARGYDSLAKEFYGEFAYLNFP